MALLTFVISPQSRFGTLWFGAFHKATIALKLRFLTVYEVKENETRQLMAIMKLYFVDCLQSEWNTGFNLG